MSSAVGVVEALDGLEGVHDRGVTFVGAVGPGQDLLLSFHELRLEVARRARSPRSLVHEKGDRAALVVPEGQDFIPTFLGAMWAGVVPVPLYPPLSLGKLDAFMDALVTILNLAEPRMLVTDERVGKALWAAIGKVASVEKVVLATELAGAPAAELAAADLSAADAAFLQFTSGSTSAPKGVVVTHGSLAANCSAIVYEGLRVDNERDVAVSWL